MNSFAAGAGVGGGADRRSSVPPNPVAAVHIAAPPLPGFTGNLAVVPPPPSMHALVASRMLEKEVQCDLDPDRARAMADRLLEVQLLGLLPPTAPPHHALRPAQTMRGEMLGSLPDHYRAPVRAGEMMALPHYPALHHPQARIVQTQAPLYHPAWRPPPQSIVPSRPEATLGERPGSGSVNNQPSLPIRHHPEGTVLEVLQVTDGKSLPPPRLDIGLLSGSSHPVDIAGQTRAGEMMALPHYPALHHSQARIVQTQAPLYHPAWRPPQSIVPSRPEDTVWERPGSGSVNNQPSLPIRHHPEGTVLEVLQVNDGESLPPPQLDIGLLSGSSHLVDTTGQTTLPSPTDSNVRNSSGSKSGQNPSLKKAGKKANKNCYRCGQSGHCIANCHVFEEEAQQMKVTNMVEEGDAHSSPVLLNHTCFRCGENGHKKNLCPLSKEEAKKHPEDENKKRKQEALVEGSAPFRPEGDAHSSPVSLNHTCFRCGENGHKKNLCPLSKKEAKKHREDEDKKRKQEAQQMKVTNMVEEGDAHSSPVSLNYTCFKCGENGHKKNLCPLSKEEAKKHREDVNKKRKQEALVEGNASFRPYICFTCGIYGHRHIDCVASNEEIEKNKKKMKKDEPKENKQTKLESLFEGKFGGKCFRCGQSGHGWKDCLVSK